jgi:hypothetical protein
MAKVCRHVFDERICDRVHLVHSLSLNNVHTLRTHQHSPRTHFRVSGRRVRSAGVAAGDRIVLRRRRRLVIQNETKTKTRLASRFL